MHFSIFVVDMPGQIDPFHWQGLPRTAPVFCHVDFVVDLPERWHSHCFCHRAGSVALAAVVAHGSHCQIVLDFFLHLDAYFVVDFGSLFPFFPSSPSFSLPIASGEFRKDELELRA